MTSPSPYNTIGTLVGRAEGPAKTTGRALYPADVKIAGTLIGKCLRSPYPYARIVSIDISEAMKVPGVHTVITGADVPDNLVGRMLCDFPILAKDLVLFAGQKVAAVAAEDPDAADEALSLIDVEYEPLEPVLDPLDALKEGATVLHPNLAEYQGFSEEPKDGPNVAAQKVWSKGDIEKGFAQSDFVFEHQFRTQHQHQGYMEPHACTVVIDEDGRVQVWINSKMPFPIRKVIADGIGLAQEKVRINPSVIGGDFGGKGGFMDTHVAYFLAKKTQRPVRMVMNYTEELTAANPRHPAVMTFKTGVMKDGTIAAREAKLIFNSGAFGAHRPFGGIVFFGPRCLGPYRIAHSKIDSSIVYTNMVPCGSMRSPGDPQSYFAGEAQMDLIAHELGMDPYEFRKKNILHDGEETPLGAVWKKVNLSKVLDRCAQESGILEERPRRAGKKIGRGMALSERPTGTGNSTAKVSIDTKGHVTLETPLRDQGAGLYTILAQIVGKELGVPYDQVTLETWDTDAVKFDSGVGGARVSHVGGKAAMGAAIDVKDTLTGLAANKYGWSPDEIQFAEQYVICRESRISLAELVQQYGKPVESVFEYEGPPNADGTVFSAQAAEVEIDLETGAIQINQITSVHDVGTILHPTSHQGQIDGSIMQGIGAALMEGLQYDGGQVINANLGDYKIPVMADIPPIKTILVKDENEGPIPHGGKAIAEQAISGVAPAIINAILDATGISMTELPVTSEAMLSQLENQMKTENTEINRNQC
ncbi:MAG: xanthine dehydrogenase family protein molybdopterin-binding subunit [SAR324 cluster bacterium]|nr:xanthine dehydrogenase family protein molybdopterin-binding subunit [SAR324 cluster bacterium]